MFNHTYLTEFDYEVNGDGSVLVHNNNVEKLKDFPELVEEILHFVNDFAITGTSYHVYVDVVKNVFGKIRIEERTIFTHND